jgi:hypothetical protein
VRAAAAALVLAAGCTIQSGSPDGPGTQTTSSTGAGGAGGGETVETVGTGGSGGEGRCAPGRSTGDRPDDAPGYQARANYVLPSDGVDEELDLDGRIATSVRSFSTWLAGQTRGRSVRLDTCDGALDVRFVRLTQTDAELRARGVFIRDAIEAELDDAGLTHPQKIEMVYYGGGAAGTCGGGAWPPALFGRVAAMYLKGTFDDPGIPPCASNPVGASPDAPGYIDFAMLHEVLHTIGMVPECAPHQTLGGHASDDPTDLMYAGDQPWQPSVLDVGRDDYFEAAIEGCADLARSAFLEPLPDGAEVPVGW